MKKQLFLSMLAAGLIGGYVNAVGSKDLIDAVRSRDADNFIASFEKFIEMKDQDALQDMERLFSSDRNWSNNFINLSDNLYGQDRCFGKFSMPAKDIMLMLAVDGQKHTIVKFLLDNGANVNIQEPFEGTTPLMLAVDNGDLKLVQLLLNYGANVHIQDKEGKTALDILLRIVDTYDAYHIAEMKIKGYGYSVTSYNRMINLLEQASRK
jgi:hypothetical protein